MPVLMRHNELVILHLTGELDLATAPELADRLAAARLFGREVLVNLEQVEFIDCAGLRVLLEAAQAARSGGPRVSVTPGPPSAQRLFALTGAAGVLRVQPGPLELAA